MNRRRADLVVGFLVAVVLVFGGTLAWQAYQQTRALDRMAESMMGTSMGAVHGPNPLWYVLGTLLVAAVIGGLYLTVRGDLSSPSAAESPAARASASTDEVIEPSPDEPREALAPEEQPRQRVLDLLPDDERRVLEPVLNSPGITQVELRDRSNFSKSKVSQTVSALEKRGLLYRERQGRTYRIYPSDELRQNHA